MIMVLMRIICLGQHDVTVLFGNFAHTKKCEFSSKRRLTLSLHHFSMQALLREEEEERRWEEQHNTRREEERTEQLHTVTSDLQHVFALYFILDYFYKL
mmetsp:Transcript_20034/g.25342  ORF Transcript_20034/g.25342 Transcript_20034/m.25342 type:complete len:99 (+) Transcript_20034:689-985(+)